VVWGFNQGQENYEEAKKKVTEKGQDRGGESPPGLF